MSFTATILVVAMALITTWWTFWGSVGGALRVRGGASPRLGMALGILGPVGALLAAGSVSERWTRSSPATGLREPPPLPGSESDTQTAELPPLPD